MKMRKQINLSMVLIMAALFFTDPAFIYAQRRVTDANDALVNSQPPYPVPYKIPVEKEVMEVLTRVRNYLDTVTVSYILNKETGAKITDFSKPDSKAILNQADFRIISYEWGVTYAGMLAVANVSKDSEFSGYVSEKLNFIGSMVPYFRKFGEQFPGVRNPFERTVNPGSLDDAGAMCAAMIKATRAGVVKDLRPQIDNYMNHIFNKQFRFPDGTFARNAPFPNSLWLDDLYMSVPALAQMGKLTGDKKYYDDAVRQILQFKSRMFNSEKGIFMHGWILHMETHPEFYWARANGWAVMAMVELLDVLPENHPQRGEVMNLLKEHLKGLARFQSGYGLWHQLLDRNDSYLETSASAMYIFAAAKAINNKWVDETTYGPMVIAGWNALTTKINEWGQVSGTCVGTGMGFEPIFYYYRPNSEYAAHGYGPVFLAGSEVIKLIRNYTPKLNPMIGFPRN